MFCCSRRAAGPSDTTSCMAPPVILYPTFVPSIVTSSSCRVCCTLSSTLEISDSPYVLNGHPSSHFHCYLVLAGDSPNHRRQRANSTFPSSAASCYLPVSSLALNTLSRAAVSPLFVGPPPFTDISGSLSRRVGTTARIHCSCGAYGRSP